MVPIILTSCWELKHVKVSPLVPLMYRKVVYQMEISEEASRHALGHLPSRLAAKDDAKPQPHGAAAANLSFTSVGGPA